MALTSEQEITWERLQYAIGVMAASPKDAVGRLPDVYNALVDDVEGIDPEAMPLTIRERYKDWLTSFESTESWEASTAMSMLHILWSLYQVFREQVETGAVVSASLPAPRPREIPLRSGSKEMALARLNLILLTVEELPLSDWQEAEIKKCSDVLGIRLPNETEDFKDYVRHVLEAVDA